MPISYIIKAVNLDSQEARQAGPEGMTAWRAGAGNEKIHFTG